MKYIKLLMLFVIPITLLSCDKIVRETKNILGTKRVHVSEFEILKNGKLNPTPYDEKINQGRLMFKEKPFTGIVFDNYSEDIFSFEYNYVDGLLDGEQKVYHSESNQIERLETFEKGIQNGPVIEYYDNGNLRTKGIFKNDIWNGPFESYFEKGTLMRKGNLKDGNYQGSYEEYYENGVLKTKGNYNDGNLDGSYEEYYENSKLKFKGNKLNGPYESYYQNGELKIKGIYKEGKRHGPYESYFENGQLDKTLVFKDGLIIKR